MKLAKNENLINYTNLESLAYILEEDFFIKWAFGDTDLINSSCMSYKPNLVKL